MNSQTRRKIKKKIKRSLSNLIWRNKIHQFTKLEVVGMPAMFLCLKNRALYLPLEIRSIRGSLKKTS
jgi:hypothetical protein